MDDRYLKGHISLQDPEGIQGGLYRIEREEDLPKYLYVDTIEYGRIQYWYFDSNKNLIDGGEIDIDDDDMDPDSILDTIRDMAEIDESAILIEEDSWLDLSDLEYDGFTGM